MNDYFPRRFDNLSQLARPKRVTVMYGPRRVGKTTLLNRWLDAQSGCRILRVSGDDAPLGALLSGRNEKAILDWAAGYDIIFIDEAQRISGIGLALKILIDARPHINLIATGSASFDLAGKVGEPLTGRQSPLTLYPLSLGELRAKMNDFEIKQNLEDFLVFGMYPEVRAASSSSEKRFILDELSNAYLLKDILEFDRLKKPHLLLDLLSLLALQIGGEVSLNELSGKLALDVKTVQRYLDLLEKCFVIYNLRGFSRNLRNEVTRTGKYFFYDTGVRNAVIQNYNPLNRRNDAGALWENFMVMERLKMRSYNAALPDSRETPKGRDYFWRTWEKQEIDLLEDYGGVLHAFEFKWSPRKNPKPPSLFMEAYPGSEYAVINPDNFTGYV